MHATRGPLLRVSVVRTGASAVVRLDGELDIATAGQVAEVLTALERKPPLPRRIVVEADQLSFVDASGLSPLLAAQQRLPPGTLRMRNARPNVLRVLRLLELAGRFGLDT